MGDDFGIRIDLSELHQLGALSRHGVFPSLASAVQRVAEAGVSRWQAAVHAAPLWQGERDAYMASIRAYQTGPYAWEIMSDYKYVEDIENGRPPRDLKAMLSTSLKVRVSAKGKRYMIIPFRHNTPGNTAHAPAMPQSVHDSAQQLSASRIVGQGTRLSGTGAHLISTRKPARVAARKYAWGDRLAAGHAPKLQARHKSDPYAGMVRFAAQTPGGKAYSTYMTFRVMVEGSSGWIVPAKPGLHIAKAVSDSLQRTAPAEFGAALQQDLSSEAA